MAGVFRKMARGGPKKRFEVAVPTLDELGRFKGAW